MKRISIFLLALLLLAPAVFAEDALVMPARVGRFYLAPSFITGGQSFDGNGNRQSAPAFTALNLGAALEFGITNWITGAVQWAPGINVWSSIDTTLPGSTSSVRLFDVGDLFVGAKMQILGPVGPIQNEDFRLAFAPGVKIPLPGPDFSEQARNAEAGNPVTPATLDNHVFGIGLRSYFDIVFSENFFLNFYNEVLFHPVRGDIRDASFAAFSVANGIDQINNPAVASYSNDVDYGFELTFEIEPVFTTRIAPGTVLRLGLPINYKTTQGTRFDFYYNETALLGIPGGDILLANIKALEAQGNQTHLLTVAPSAAIFFQTWSLPMEFKLTHITPIWGQNASANHILSFQIRMYFRI